MPDFTFTVYRNGSIWYIVLSGTPWTCSFVYLHQCFSLSAGARTPNSVHKDVTFLSPEPAMILESCLPKFGEPISVNYRHNLFGHLRKFHLHINVLELQAILWVCKMFVQGRETGGTSSYIQHHCLVLSKQAGRCKIASTGICAFVSMFP